MWSFGNGFARYIVIFGFNITSSSYTDNQKNRFLVLGGGPTEGINDSVGAAEKSLILTSVKQRQHFV